ncbi:hypothetical protein WISP_91355 [Willisornis vidua]|uniref:Uncharacterized protein n=1 Tax=Willisornis vidua TaxID=1566151 RepID=A0ABQ9D1B9_9PASS|nr:hypothetical protein WISP_91355 [Willisornis vidua]
MVAFLGCKCTSEPHLNKVSLNLFILQPGLIPGVTLTQILLDGILSFRCINSTTQLGVICKYAEDALAAFIHVINEATCSHFSRITLISVIDIAIEFDIGYIILINVIELPADVRHTETNNTIPVGHFVTYMPQEIFTWVSNTVVLKVISLNSWDLPNSCFLNSMFKDGLALAFEMPLLVGNGELHCARDAYSLPFHPDAFAKAYVIK